MERETVPDLGTTKQLFVDDQIISQAHGVVRTLNQPAKYVGNPLFFPLYPWEGRVELYGTVLRDPASGHFRMWYTGLGRMGVTQMDAENTSKWAAMGFDPQNLLYSTCFATSTCATRAYIALCSSDWWMRTFFVQPNLQVMRM